MHQHEARAATGIVAPAAAVAPVRQGTDQDHGDGHATAHRAEHLADGFQQVLGHAGPFQDDAHEGEEGDGEQCVIRHHPPEPFGHRIQQRPGEVDRIGERRELHADDRRRDPAHRNHQTKTRLLEE